MNVLKSIAAATLLFSCLPVHAQDLSDPGWPRTFSNGASTAVVYQPQIDSWTDFKIIRGRCAFVLTLAAGTEPIYGTFRFEADTLADTATRVVLMRNIRVFDMRFPGATAAKSVEWSDAARRLVPSEALVVSLDRVLAFVHAGEVPRQEAHVLTEPPPIFFSSRPAILVIIDGEPVTVDVEKTGLRRIINTNGELYQDPRANVYYLRDVNSWLKASDLQGIFVRATDLPPGLDKLPERLTSEDPAPRVFVTHKPAELIVIEGNPALAPIKGTHLASVTNTESDLFVDTQTGAYYFLTAGRWFRAQTLEGPWQYASASLPEDFQRIPLDHPRAHVLSSVPGTREAEDAVLLAVIPRTAEISRKEAKADVQYVGAPQFEPIQGTSITYAKNTPSDALRIGDLYYLCFQGVWFISANPTGPWQVADRVPSVIYSIPESSPKYNVTYVRIYESTAATVVVGYTPGYYGVYVSGGVVVWGTGYYYPPYVAVGVATTPVYWGASTYTYGASVRYNPATGVYARGSAVYGPYGGYGAGAVYNPRTGTYAQGAAGWGPNGGIAAGRTYNPATGTYSGGYKASNPYGNWGEGVVGKGNNWARGGYQTTSRGTVWAGETSQGGKGIAAQGVNGNQGYIGKSANGDIYAGANGNVYKRDNGQWYENQNGSWNAVNKSDLSAPQQQGAARDRGNWNAEKSSGAGMTGTEPAGRSSKGVPQRPNLRGRRR